LIIQIVSRTIGSLWLDVVVAKRRLRGGIMRAIALLDTQAITEEQLVTVVRAEWVRSELGEAGLEMRTPAFDRLHIAVGRH